MERQPAPDETHALVIGGSTIALPEGACRLDLPRADRLWTALVKERVVVASGEGYVSAQVLEGQAGERDQAIGRPNDKLWGTRIDPLYVGAPVFAAIAAHSAGRRWVVGRRLSTIARRFLAAGPGHVFIGVEGELTSGAATQLADALLEGMLSAPYEPLTVVVRMVARGEGRLVVLGDASLSYAQALEAAPRSHFAAVAARQEALAKREALARRPLALRGWSAA